MTDLNKTGVITMSRSVFKGLFWLLALLLAAACTITSDSLPTVVPTAQPAGTISSNSWPQSQAECERAGGRWQQLGLIGMGCNLPASDGGQPCTAMQDCQGLCLPADSKTMIQTGSGQQIPNSEFVQQVNDSGRDIQGICSEWRSIFGCIVVVDAGRYQEICID